MATSLDTAPAGALRRYGMPAVATAVAALVAALARWGPDWPAQEFRAFIATSEPLAWWANGWFSGQPLGGYSLLFPLLSSVLGAAAVGVGSVAVAAWAAGRLVPNGSPRATVAVEIAIVSSLVSSLVQGQLPYLLGTAFALCALTLDRAGRGWWVAPAAALCCLSSPLAGFFLLIAAAATSAVRPVRQLAPYAAALLGFVVPLVLGGASGPNPYPVTSLLAALAFGGALIAAFRDSSPLNRVLRRFGWLYLLATVALLPVANAVGGNIARLGMQLALPIGCLAVRQAVSRRGLVLGVAVLAAAWCVWPTAVSIAHGAHDPSQRRAYFAPLLRFLDHHRPGDHRVEIPLTREHWEARWVAATLPLARGWERQTDIQYNRVLYQPLTAATYRRWLDANAVGWVALPDIPLDTGGAAEAALLRHPPAWLRPAWHNANWTLWRVNHAPPIVSRPATLQRLGESTIVVRFAHAGSSLVRVHAASLWHITRGSGCLMETPSGWMRVIAPRGRLTLATGLSSGSGTDRCPPPRQR